MTTGVGLTLMLALPGQLPVGPPFLEDGDVRLSDRKDSVVPDHNHRAAAGSPPIRLLAEPIYRLDAALIRIRDSAIFLGTDAEAGRPFQCSERPTRDGATRGRRCRRVQPRFGNWLFS